MALSAPYSGRDKKCRRSSGPRNRTSVPAGRAAHALKHMTRRQSAGDPVRWGPRRVRRLDDTWAWDGDLWTPVADTSPPARPAHAMVDERRASGSSCSGAARGSTCSATRGCGSERGWRRSLTPARRRAITRWLTTRGGDESSPSAGRQGAVRRHLGVGRRGMDAGAGRWAGGASRSHAWRSMPPTPPDAAVRWVEDLNG